MSYLYNYHANKKERDRLRIIMERRKKDMINCNRNARILVVLHLFYLDSWLEICEYLKNLRPYKWDLIITYPTFLEDKIDKEIIKLFKKNVKFMCMDNYGFDIGPFIMALKNVNLDNYEIVYKIQSKGVKRKKIYIYKQLFLGRDWFVNLYEGCLGARNIHDGIDILLNEDRIGAICADNLIVSDPVYKRTMVLNKLSELGLATEENYKFIAGTCFAIKSSLLKEFQEYNFKLEDFKPIPNSRGMSLAHVLERYFGICINNKGYIIKGLNTCEKRRFFKKPIESLLSKISSERLLSENFYINEEYFHWILDNKFIRYKVRTVEVGKLKYYSHRDKRDFFIKECVPYKYLLGDKEVYKEYSQYHIDNNLPVMTSKRFDKLVRSIDKNGYDDRNIIMVNERNMICDGQHRACYLAYKFGLDYKINVLEVEMINKKQLIKLFIPKFIKVIYYKKKYSCY